MKHKNLKKKSETLNFYLQVKNLVLLLDSLFPHEWMKIQVWSKEESRSGHIKVTQRSHWGSGLRKGTKNHFSTWTSSSVLLVLLVGSDILTAFWPVGFRTFPRWRLATTLQSLVPFQSFSRRFQGNCNRCRASVTTKEEQPSASWAARPDSLQWRAVGSGRTSAVELNTLQNNSPLQVNTEEFSYWSIQQLMVKVSEFTDCWNTWQDRMRQCCASPLGALCHWMKQAGGSCLSSYHQCSSLIRFSTLTFHSRTCLTMFDTFSLSDRPWGRKYRPSLTGGSAAPQTQRATSALLLCIE